MELLAVSLYPNAGETFTFMMTGFAVVLCVLAIMSIMTNLMGIPFKVLEKKANEAAAKKKAAAPVAPAPVVAKQGNAATAELAGVISSAVYAVLDGAPHRIVSIRPASEVSPEIVAVLSAAAAAVLGCQCQIVSVKPAAPDFNWANSGRNSIYGSHRPKM